MRVRGGSTRVVRALLLATLGSLAVRGAGTARASPTQLPGRAVTLDARAFGAVGDGVTDNTASIEAALRNASKHARDGGATLVFPGPGVYMSAPFNLTSNCTLWIGANATIKAVDDFERFPVVAPLPGYGTGRDHLGPRRAPFIGGYNLTDVVIAGDNGTIDGAGWEWWYAHLDGREAATNITRPRLIELMFTTGLVITNVTLVNSPFWTVHPYACENVTARFLTILNHQPSPNTDGFDPDSSQDVLVEHSYFQVGDDGVAIKSGWDCAGLEFGRPSRNIFIRNLTVNSPKAAGVCIGSEMSGGVENVTVVNSHFVNCHAAVRLKSSSTRGAYIRNVTFANSTSEDVAITLFVSDFYGDPNPACNASYVAPEMPRLSGITLENWFGQRSALAVDIEGLQDSPIEGVRVHNLTLGDSGGWRCSNVKGIATECSPRPCGPLLSRRAREKQKLRTIALVLHIVAMFLFCVVGLARMLYLKRSKQSEVDTQGRSHEYEAIRNSECPDGE